MTDVAKPREDKFRLISIGLCELRKVDEGVTVSWNTLLLELLVPGLIVFLVFYHVRTTIYD